jgi:hypothetical protein
MNDSESNGGNNGYGMKDFKLDSKSNQYSREDTPNKSPP